MLEFPEVGEGQSFYVDVKLPCIASFPLHGRDIALVSLLGSLDDLLRPPRCPFPTSLPLISLFFHISPLNLK